MLSSNDVILILSYYCFPILFAFGIPGNAFCVAIFATKAKENRAYYYRIVNVVNDLVLLIMNIFYCCFYFWFFPANGDGYKSYGWVCFYVYVCNQLLNVAFNISPFLMLNTCIERNKAILVPFAFIQREKSIIVTVVAVEFTIALINNGFDAATESIINYSNVTTGYLPIANTDIPYGLKQFVNIFNITVIIFTEICAMLILVLTITFIHHYIKLQYSRRYLIMPLWQLQSSNDKILAVILVAQSVLVILPQACIIPYSYFNSSIAFNNCYTNCESANQILNILGNLLTILNPASNFYVFFVISKDFRRLSFELFKQFHSTVTEKVRNMCQTPTGISVIDSRNL